MFLATLLFSTLVFAGNNSDDSPLPPRVLYHVGHKPYLLDDDRLGTIEKDVWNDSIMGSKTRFGLVPYRRGLYGGARPDNLEIFGNEYLGSPSGVPRTPWLMKITLRDECRKPGAVSDLGTDDRYLGWLAANTKELVRNAPFCLDAKAKNCRDLIVGTQPVSGGVEENTCDDVMQKFMKDVNPRVVRDSEWPSSWYLRDRTCIEKLEASPAAVLAMLADWQWDAESRESTKSGKYAGYGTASIAILFGALADSDNADATALSKLREKTAASDIRLRARDPARFWVREAGPELVDAYERCRKKGALAVFRAAEKDFEKRLNDPAFPGQGALESDGPEKAADALAALLPKLCS
jgi:hypothetical protein